MTFFKTCNLKYVYMQKWELCTELQLKDVMNLVRIKLGIRHLFNVMSNEKMLCLGFNCSNQDVYIFKKKYVDKLLSKFISSLKSF